MLKSLYAFCRAESHLAHNKKGHSKSIFPIALLGGVSQLFTLK